MISTYIRVSDILSYSKFLRDSFFFKINSDIENLQQEFLYNDPILGDTKFIIIKSEIEVVKKNEFIYLDDSFMMNKKCTVFFSDRDEDLIKRALLKGAKKSQSCNCLVDIEGYRWGIFNIDRDLKM